MVNSNLKFLKYFISGVISTLFILPIIFISISKEDLIKNYRTFLSIKNRIQSKFNHKKYEFISKENFEKCLPNIIFNVPNNSSIIIGHAYGNSSIDQKGSNTINPSSYSISPKIFKFLDINKVKIDNVFFTGDVFRIPSLNGWENLYKSFSNYFNIYIAPGNHDVVNLPLSRDLFTAYVGKKQPRNFPFKVIIPGFEIIVDDSNVIDSIFNKAEKLKKINPNNNFLILRHHVAIKELTEYSGNNSFLYTKKSIEKKFQELNGVTIISGNGGMDYSKPSIACYKHKNITHLLSGIGDFQKDNLLILNDGNIYRYPLNK